MADVKEKTYILIHDDGTRKKITVPENWKVTFGPAAKGMNSSNNGTNLKMPLALRFYEDEKHQRAIFTDVKSFMDSSIKIEEEIVNIKEKDGFVECDGVKKRTTFQAKTKEWVNINDVRENQPLLPEDSTMFEFDNLKEDDQVI